MTTHNNYSKLSIQVLKCPGCKRGRSCSCLSLKHANKLHKMLCHILNLQENLKFFDIQNKWGN